MRKFFSYWLLALLVLTSTQLSAKKFNWGGSSGDDFFDDASVKIEKRVAAGKQPALDKVYKELFYAPVWVKSTGLSPYGISLLKLIKSDETVTPSVKFYDEIESVEKRINDLIAKNGGSVSDKVSLEIEMSKLYVHYAQYRINGGISWGPFMEKLDKLTKAYKIKVGWEKYAPPASSASVLNDALADGSLEQSFEDADPRRFHYKELRDYLVRYIKISQNGGWPKLPSFGTLKPGATNAKVVPLIRKHLSMVGDLQGCSEPMDSPKYDACLVKAVKRFQLRHGLKGDGVIGRGARAALNQTVTQAIQKMRLNLDRIKWLSRKESNMRMELNIPSFRLNFFDKDKLVTTIRVVTGKPNHPTPTFHNVMKYIVVNPWWKIPASIVRHEMLSKLIRDPYHYEAQGKEVHTSWDESSPRVDPGTVDWSQYQGNNKAIPYYFMQVPSRHNALGKIKFLFPNGYQVYIHDTPSKSLFFRNVRAFSHGCMRIQKPRELLESLALFNDNIDVDGVMKQLEGTEKKTIVLKHKVPIDITYLTAFVDPYGNLNFRKDIYRYDKYQMKNYATKAIPLPRIKKDDTQKKSKAISEHKPQKKIKRPPEPKTKKGSEKGIQKKEIPKKNTKTVKSVSKKKLAEQTKVKKVAKLTPKKTIKPNKVKPAAKTIKRKPEPKKVIKATKPKVAKQLPKPVIQPVKEKAEKTILPETPKKKSVNIKYKKTKKDADGYDIIEIYDN